MTQIQAKNEAKREDVLIRRSFEKKGYSMRMQSQRTKAVADTLNIANEELKLDIVRDVNNIGRHVISDLNVKQWTEKDDETLKYVQALVAMTSPTIPGGKNFEYEFENSVTSGALLDMKRSKRHLKANQLLERDPMFIVPKD